MKQSCLETMSDREVVERLEELLRQERRLTALVLAHLGEVEARRLYLPAACSSMHAMHAYCTRVLGMSDDGAFKRIRAARAVRRFPVVGAPPEPPVRGAAKVSPLSPERFALQVTIGEATRSKVLRAQALLRHQVPSGDLAEVLDLALDALLEKVEARKFGTVKRPRAAKASRSRRYVPRAARRKAVERDGARCSFVAEDGRRCEETGFLELDHVVPVARGGDASEGVRILCRSHNQFEAERILGREVVDAGRGARSGEARPEPATRVSISGPG